MLLGGLWAEMAWARPCGSSWSMWQAYVQRFISADARVIDPSAGGITTSEGQSYALFFALVAGDRPLFDRLLRWTSDNLAEGRFGARLPSYKWGRRRDGSWGILDPNSASDSDLWIGYVLIEAGRLWADPGLSRRGRALLAQVVAREVRFLPGLGPMLLPAPYGFVHGSRWRLNPSYLPPQVLRGLVAEGVPGPWRAIWENARLMIDARAVRGFVDDWVGYDPRAGFVTDWVKGPIGSYDAIRTYLWAGLLPGDDPERRWLQARLGGPLRAWRIHRQVPEQVDTTRRGADLGRSGPVGFLGVLLPALQASGDGLASAALEQQIEAVRNGSLYGRPPGYYDQNLLLFARGFVEGRYRFDAQGRLVPAWTRCAAR